jgi:hypothetical protein
MKFSVAQLPPVLLPVTSRDGQDCAFQIANNKSKLAVDQRSLLTMTALRWLSATGSAEVVHDGVPR